MVSLDGKTVKASFDRATELSPVHTARLLWSRGETAGAPDDLVPSKTYRLSDERDFQSGPHKGFRWVSEALIDAARLPSKSAAPVC